MRTQLITHTRTQLCYEHAPHLPRLGQSIKALDLAQTLQLLGPWSIMADKFNLSFGPLVVKRFFPIFMEDGTQNELELQLLSTETSMIWFKKEVHLPINDHASTWTLHLAPFYLIISNIGRYTYFILHIKFNPLLILNMKCRKRMISREWGRTALPYP